MGRVDLCGGALGGHVALTAPPSSAPGTEAPPFLGPAGPVAQARASVAGQSATYLIVVLAIALVGGATGLVAEAILPAVALTVGIGMGLGTVVGRWFEKFPGLVGALITVPVVTVLVALAPGLVPVPTIVVVPFLVLGLDWRLVSRLRILPFVAGLAILGPVGTEQGWAYPAALAWLAGALATLWILQNDERTALARPTPLGGPATDPDPRPLDLARTLAVAVLVGLAVAFLLGRPSCSQDTPPVDPQAQPPSGGEGMPGGEPGGTGGSQRDARPGEVPPERDLGGDAEPGDGRGGERKVEVDEEGNRYLEDPETGERYPVTEEDGRVVARDADGEVVAELDEDGSVVASDGEGSQQRYQVDEDGRLYVESDDGDRFYLDDTGDGVVLRDEDGRVVAEGGDADDHLVVRDPEGDVLVPDPDGDGDIPMPNGGVRDALPGSGGSTTYRTDGDTTVAVDRDGEVRTYDRDFVGRDRVTVERPGRPDRSYVYDETGPYPTVLEYDEDGRLVKRYRYDPDGIIVDQAPADGAAGGGSSGSGGAGQPNQVADETTDQSPATPDADDPAKEDDGPFPWWVVAVVVAAIVAAVVGVILWRRRQPPTDPRLLPWAVALTEQLTAHGTAHGRSRGRSETIAAYSAALAGGVLPDPRLVDVGQVLSAAFFAPTAPSAADRARAEATMAEVIATHPIPGRSERRAPTKEHATA